MVKPTQQDIDDFLGYHLPYEVEMLRATHILLRHGIPLVAGDKDWKQLIANVFIKSFCVHARNLIEFFEKEAGATSTRGISPATTTFSATSCCQPIRKFATKLHTSPSIGPLGNKRRLMTLSETKCSPSWRTSSSGLREISVANFD